MPKNRETYTAIVVDDEEIGRLRMQVLCEPLRDDCDLQLLTTESVDEAITLLKAMPVHLLLLDKNLYRRANGKMENAIKRIPEMLALQPNVGIFVVTGSSNSADAVEALKLGAIGYLRKDSPDELIRAQIARALSSSKPRGVHLRAITKEPFDVLGPEFPGLPEFLKMVEGRVLLEARSKLSKNKDIAAALGISPGMTSRKLEDSGLRIRGKNSPSKGKRRNS